MEVVSKEVGVVNSLMLYLLLGYCSKPQDSAYKKGTAMRRPERSWCKGQGQDLTLKQLTYFFAAIS